MNLIRAQIIIRIMNKASENLHDKMLTRVARSKILFFDSNPVGRILARFSKDISVIDNLLPGLTNICMQGMMRTICVFTMLIILNPFMLIPLSIAVVCMVLVFRRVINVTNSI